MIIYLTGYSGAGKTTAVKAFLSQGECLSVERTFPSFQKGGQVCAYSTWLVLGAKIAVIGYEPSTRLNRQGGDAFFFAKKAELGAWLASLDESHDFVIFDFFSISPSLIKTVQDLDKDLKVIWVSTDIEVCIAARTARAMTRMRFTEARYRKFMQGARNSFLKCTASKIECERDDISTLFSSLILGQ